MSKNQLVAMIAAILTTLSEQDSGCPESMLYILCGMDMDKWNTLRGVMVNAEWVSIKGNFVTLTSGGRAMAEQINRSLVAKAQA